MRMTTLKRLLTLFMVIFCLLAAAAIADTNGMDVQLDAQNVAFSFEIEGEQYAYVQVTTKNDVGKLLLYSENGQFSGEMALPNCFEESKLTIDVMKLNNRRVYRYTGETVEVRCRAAG